MNTRRQPTGRAAARALLGRLISSAGTGQEPIALGICWAGLTNAALKPHAGGARKRRQYAAIGGLIAGRDDVVARCSQRDEKNGFAATLILF